MDYTFETSDIKGSIFSVTKVDGGLEVVANQFTYEGDDGNITVKTVVDGVTYEDTATLRIYGKEPTGVTIIPNPSPLVVGATDFTTAVFEPVGSDLKQRIVQWTSSEPSVLSLTNDTNTVVTMKGESVGSSDLTVTVTTETGVILTETLTVIVDNA